ncbi:MAG: AAA family ATPase [Gammaproteobacteria bacterium]|nr:AAA family ATPase [Gammaproteobacteria bacterium]
MRSILVLNAKGGCGKSTLATNLASYFAWEEGKQVALADFDPQSSSLAWLKARSEQWPVITGLDGSQGSVRAPRDTEVLILDAPAAVHGKDITALVRKAETVLVPVLPSPMDMRAAADFIQELLKNGQVSRGDSKLAIIANRVRENTLIYQKLHEFLKKLGIPLVATLRDTQNYVRAAERGVGIFEMAPSAVWQDVEQWQPLIRYLRSKRSRAA